MDMVCSLSEIQDVANVEEIRNLKSVKIYFKLSIDVGCEVKKNK